MTNSLENKNFWYLVIGISVVGALTSRFAPELGLQIGEEILNIINPIALGFCMIFFGYGFQGHEKSNEELFTTVFVPILIISFVLPVFGVSYVYLMMYVFGFLFAPFFGKMMRAYLYGKAYASTYEGKKKRKDKFNKRYRKEFGYSEESDDGHIPDRAAAESVRGLRTAIIEAGDAMEDWRDDDTSENFKKAKKLVRRARLVHDSADGVHKSEDIKDKIEDWERELKID